jgi:peptidoglycan/xylan/chitin deacetylase (PgdA/CDA1 family)
MEVTTSDFERQLNWLVENRAVVTLDEALSRWHEAGSERLVVLTFDDGYRDTYSIAFPLLRDRDLPFTLYLATESIETGQALGPVPGAEPLDWDQVRIMSETGLMTVGAHTHRHVDMRTLSRDEAEDELGTSDRLIGERLGVTPAHFAYPWGFWSESADAGVSRRYRSATLAGISNHAEDFDPHRLRRFPVQLSDGFRWFESRLRGGFRLEEAIRRRRNRYVGP